MDGPRLSIWQRVVPLAGLFVAGFLVVTPIVAKEKISDTQKSRALADVGLDFERARALPVAERQAGLEAVAATMEALMADDLPYLMRIPGWTGRASFW